MKILELPQHLSVAEVEKQLSDYEYLHSYPLEYRNADGMVKVIRYFVKEKTKTLPKKEKK